MTTLNLFRHTTDVESYAAGQVIFEKGQPGDVMYVVREGQVSIVLNGTEIDSAGPGGIIGEMALIDDQPRSATAIATTYRPGTRDANRNPADIITTSDTEFKILSPT